MKWFNLKNTSLNKWKLAPTNEEILEKFNWQKLTGIVWLQTLMKDGKILKDGCEYDFTDILKKYSVKIKLEVQRKIVFSPNQEFINKYFWNTIEYIKEVKQELTLYKN